MEKIGFSSFKAGMRGADVCSSKVAIVGTVVLCKVQAVYCCPNQPPVLASIPPLCSCMKPIHLFLPWQVCGVS